MVYNTKSEYNSWKHYNLFSKIYKTDIIKNICFFIYENIFDKRYLNVFFECLAKNDFDTNQIDYILEMAPKLRIASYLNEEYAKYKKLYNPDARDFNFGKDGTTTPVWQR